MTWWGRSRGGRHARRVVDPGLVVQPARIGSVPPEPDPEPVVRLVFDDGSAVALDSHDPRSRAFRALADGMLEPRRAATAQGGTGEADAHEESDMGGVPGERGLG